MGGSFGDSDIAFWDLPYELVRQYAPADTDNTYALHLWDISWYPWYKKIIRQIVIEIKKILYA